MTWRKEESSDRRCVDCHGKGHIDIEIVDNHGLIGVAARFCPSCAAKDFEGMDKKLVETSMAFRNFLLEDEQMELLPGFGWSDGGCRSLMRALLLWFDDKRVVPYQLSRHPYPSHGEHGLVRIGDFYIDGEGISTKEGLMELWSEQCSHPLYLHPFDPVQEPPLNGEVPCYIEDDKMRVLAEKLDERFNKKEVLQLLLTHRAENS